MTEIAERLIATVCESLESDVAAVAKKYRPRTVMTTSYGVQVGFTSETSANKFYDAVRKDFKASPPSSYHDTDPKAKGMGGTGGHKQKLHYGVLVRGKK